MFQDSTHPSRIVDTPTIRPSAGRRTRVRWLPTGYVVVAAGVAAILTLASVGSTFVTSLLLGLVAGAYVLALHNPAMALAPIIISELSIPGYLPGSSLSMRLATTLASTLIASVAVLRGINSRDARSRRVLWPAIAFFGVVTVMNFMHSDDAYVFKYFRYQLTQVLALILTAFLIRTRRDLKFLAIVALILGTISGFAAVWQHFEPDSALYAAGDAGVVRGWKGRAIGLSPSPVTLSADTLFVLMPILGILIAGPLLLDRPRIRLAAAAAIIFVGSYFSYTRSALLSIGIGMAVMGLYLRGSRRAFVLGSLIVLALMFPLLEGTGLIARRYYRDTDEDRSAASHLVAWKVSLAIALDNPITGIGHERYAEVAPEYLEVAGVEESDAGGTLSLESGEALPHNDFLNVWFSWGIAAFLAYLALFIGALVNCAVAARSPDLLIRGLAIGTAGGLIAYGANSTLHNLLDNSAYLFIYAGLSVALARIAWLTRRPDAIAMRDPV